jgi:hypothetical protein
MLSLQPAPRMQVKPRSSEYNITISMLRLKHIAEQECTSRCMISYTFTLYSVVVS